SGARARVAELRARAAAAARGALAGARAEHAGRAVAVGGAREQLRLMARLGGMLIAYGAIIGLSDNLGYLLPAIIGLESMGIPSPGETALVAAAVLASQGKLQIWLVILIGVTSAIVGDNIGYWLGRRYGRTVFMAPGPFLHHRVHAVRYGDGFFKRHGAKAVFLGRWIALVRFATAWLAGINRMPIKRFFFWNAFGGITWGITYGLVGYY